MAVNYVKQWECPSKSNPSKPHKVSLKEDGEYICGCWPFRNNRTCKHIDEVKLGLHPEIGEPESSFRFIIVPGNVTEVTVRRFKPGSEVEILYPLIPLDARQTHMDATIVYDLHEMGVPYEQIRKLDRHVLKKNSIADVINYVKDNGRMIWSSTEHPGSPVKIVPV